MTIYDQISRSDPLKGLAVKATPTPADSIIVADAADGGKAKQAPYTAGSAGSASLIYDEVVAVATQNRDIVLPAGVHAFELLINAVNDDANTANYSLYVEGDYVDANYHRNGVSVTNGATPAAGYEAASPLFLGVGTGDAIHCNVQGMCGPLVFIAHVSIHYRDTSDNLITRTQTMVYNAANPTTISSIRIATDRASGIGVGTRIIVRDLEK